MFQFYILSASCQDPLSLLLSLTAITSCCCPLLLALLHVTLLLLGDLAALLPPEAAPRPGPPPQPRAAGDRALCPGTPGVGATLERTGSLLTLPHLGPIPRTLASINTRLPEDFPCP